MSTSQPVFERGSARTLPQDLDHVFDLELVAPQRLRGNHALRLAATVPQNHERRLAKDAQPVDPSPEPDFAGMNRKCLR